MSLNIFLNALYLPGTWAHSELVNSKSSEVTYGTHTFSLPISHVHIHKTWLQPQLQTSGEFEPQRNLESCSFPGISKEY